jgi:SAM-dependent methyltransferase
LTSDSTQPETDPGARYMKNMVAGAQYVEAITSLESDRRARAAFQALVLRVVAPGSTLFDFGAGAGIDARFFAEQGFTVQAYDVDPRMREYFAEHCRDLIDAGRIALDSRRYAEFVTSRPAGSGARAAAVISNFAPLNLVDDLHGLFAKFHDITGPNGKVIASVLSPYFFDDMKLGWWWRNAGRMRRAGWFFLPGPQAPHFRRRLANFAALSAPYFKLARVFRGLPPSPGRRARGVEFSTGARFAWLRATTSRFMFLEFEKCDPHAAASGDTRQAPKAL